MKLCFEATNVFLQERKSTRMTCLVFANILQKLYLDHSRNVVDVLPSQMNDIPFRC